MQDYGQEFAQSNTFWVFVTEALQNSWMVRLCRIYDNNSRSLNLYNFLETIKANMHFFETDHFRERLSDNPFVELLAKDDRIPGKDQLEKDIEYASSNKNSLVKKLMIWRNNIVAHKGTHIVLANDKLLKDNPLSFTEIDELLNKSHEIMNRYSDKFRASTFMKGFPGDDDYKWLLKLLRLGLQKWREERGM
ncbi:MAG: hypothetical protein P8Y66_06740 [Nitrospirota bacterium]